MKILITFIYFLTTVCSYAIEKPDINNIILIEKPKIYKDVIFKDINGKDINISEYKGKLLILNFWATWCAPCKEEMPSLDRLIRNVKFKNLKIFPINVGQENSAKSKNFFETLNIQNLEIYFDPKIKLVKKFTLRGIPTSIIFNKKGEEFARVIGSIDFNDEEFIKWLSYHN